MWCKAAITPVFGNMILQKSFKYADFMHKNMYYYYFMKTVITFL